MIVFQSVLYGTTTMSQPPHRQFAHDAQLGAKVHQDNFRSAVWYRVKLGGAYALYLIVRQFRFLQRFHNCVHIGVDIGHRRAHGAVVHGCGGSARGYPLR